jgi:hypothetical protein
MKTKPNASMSTRVFFISTFLLSYKSIMVLQALTTSTIAIILDMVSSHLLYGLAPRRIRSCFRIPGDLGGFPASLVFQGSIPFVPEDDPFRWAD